MGMSLDATPGIRGLSILHLQPVLPNSHWGSAAPKICPQDSARKHSPNFNQMHITDSSAWQKPEQPICRPAKNSLIYNTSIFPLSFILSLAFSFWDELQKYSGFYEIAACFKLKASSRGFLNVHPGFRASHAVFWDKASILRPRSTKVRCTVGYPFPCKQLSMAVQVGFFVEFRAKVFGPGWQLIPKNVLLTRGKSLHRY